MQIDRRSLLKGAAGMAVGSFVPVRLASAAGAAERSIRLDMATFTKYVGTPFKFKVGSRIMTMPLSTVVDDRTAVAKTTRGAGESFSLMFAGPLPPFGQATYSVDHSAFGRLSLFVVPVGRRTTGQDYQVAFNRCLV